MKAIRFQEYGKQTRGNSFRYKLYTIYSLLIHVVCILRLTHLLKAKKSVRISYKIKNCQECSRINEWIDGLIKSSCRAYNWIWRFRSVQNVNKVEIPTFSISRPAIYWITSVVYTLKFLILQNFRQKFSAAMYFCGSLSRPQEGRSCWTRLRGLFQSEENKRMWSHSHVGPSLLCIHLHLFSSDLERPLWVSKHIS